MEGKDEAKATSQPRQQIYSPDMEAAAALVCEALVELRRRRILCRLRRGVKGLTGPAAGVEGPRLGGLRARPDRSLQELDRRAGLTGPRPAGGILFCGSAGIPGAECALPRR